MGQNLGPLNIRDSYQDLVQISGSQITNGTGSLISELDVTVTTANTASYVAGANVDGAVANATNAVTATSATTATSASHALIADNGGVTSIIAGTNISIDQGTGAVTVSAADAAAINTGSFFVDASVSDATLTFTQGDGSTLDRTVDNVSNAAFATNAGSATNATNATTADTASYVQGANVDGTVALATTASYAISASEADNAATATSASHALIADSVLGSIENAVSASYILGSGVDGAVALATEVDVTTQTSGQYRVAFTDEVGTDSGISNSTTLLWDQSSGALNAGNSVTATTFNGNLSGNASTATSASYATSASEADSASTATTASYVAGANVDGAVANATDAVNADNVALASDATDAERFVTFVGFQSGDYPILTDAGLKYNPSTNKLTTTGDLAIEGVADVSASIALAAEGGGDPFPFVGDAEITGSLTISGSITFVGGEGRVVLNEIGLAISPDLGVLYPNLLIGSRAGANLTTGTQNTVIGPEQLFGDGAGENLTTGQQNVIIGAAAGHSLNQASNNVVIGHGNLQSGTNNSNRNVYIGDAVARDVTSGDNNTRIGRWSGYNANGASNAVSVGYRSGWKDLGSRNIFIGENVVGQNSANFTDSNHLAIGSSETAADNLLFGYHGTSAARFLDVNGALNVSGSIVASGSVAGEVGVLAIASNTASMDCSTGNFFTLALPAGGAVEIDPSNIQKGSTVSLEITQNATAATVTFPSEVTFEGGNAFEVSTASGAKDVMTFISFDGSNFRATGLKDFS